MDQAMTQPGSMLLHVDLVERRVLAQSGASAARAPLAALADSLAHDLEPLIHAPLPIPERKARLTRAGGRCPEHGTFLDFDPWKPHDHWCARCDLAYHGRAHDDWWAMGAQLWTAERAVHAASLFALRGDPQHATLAVRILRTYADRYHSWPNTDNVLGPTRPFFSTYLESIWLLNLCHALALLEAAPSEWTDADASRTREQLLEPSASLIASYHEGGSNRQVWNEMALCSAWCLLDRQDAVRRRLDSDGGLRWQIGNGLDDAGAWYEGENYHLFAHRGLWYGVELMRSLNEPLAPELDARYSKGFVAPFAGVLPDDTFPSRRDSQYASSIRQWRTAEWCELGWTHSRARPLAGVLSRLYDGRGERRDTGRWRSTADAERNTPATSLTRADLSWRALLMADATLPPALVIPPTSVCLSAQGLAVIRRDVGRTYVALEGGQLGGGHGHPDQLALTLQTGKARWLEDPGTGSYVEAELQWYRSTLAHHAPLIDRASQAPVPARLVAFEDLGDVAWMVKRVEGLADGVSVDRTIVVGDGYLVDVVEWESDEPHCVELPIVGKADLLFREGDGWTPLVNLEHRCDDVMGMIARTESTSVNDTLHLRAYPTFAEPMHHGVAPRVQPTGGDHGDCARVWYALDNANAGDSTPSYLMRARVPAAPGHGITDRHWLVTHGARGRIVGVWSWPSVAWPGGVVSSVHLSPEGMPCVRVTTHLGVTVTHSRIASGWHIQLDERGAHRSVTLSGFRNEAPMVVPARVIPSAAARADYVLPWIDELTDVDEPGSPIPGAHVLELGESHYVRTEETWREAGKPTATVQMAATPLWLVVDVYARTGTLATNVPDGLGRLDNEVPDINADGLQWYMARADLPPSPARGWHAAALHVPGSTHGVGGPGRQTRIAGIVDASRFTWTAMPDGWAIRLCWPRSTLPLDATGALYFELVVNERPPDRERRRGQLVLSGGGGFGYLMGNRRPTSRFVRLVIP